MAFRIGSIFALFALAILCALALAALVDASGSHDLRSVRVAAVAGWGADFEMLFRDLFAPALDGAAGALSEALGTEFETNRRSGLFILLGLILFLPWLRANAYKGGLRPSLFTALFMGGLASVAVVIATALDWPGDVFNRGLITGVLIGLPFIGLAISNVFYHLARKEKTGFSFSMGWERGIAAVIYFTVALGAASLMELTASSSAYAWVLTLSLMLLIIGAVEVHTSQYRGQQQDVFRGAGLVLIAIPVTTWLVFVADWMILIGMLPGETI
ncbi:MAG: hypothetical protein AAF216_07270 [Pseudomonadota bacterium]